MKRLQLNDYVTLGSTADEGGEILIYGNISDEQCLGDDDTVTPKQIHDSLKMFTNIKYLDLRICSNGGSTIAGNAIIEIIDSFKRNTGIPVYAHIDGIAASMGSGIAMVADKIFMAENALMMLHKPYTIAFGNESELQKDVEILQKVEDTIVRNYMRHFRGTEKELRDMLAEETWLTAKEALACGLCDEITEPIQIAASADGIKIQNIIFPHKDISTKFYNFVAAPNQKNVDNNIDNTKFAEDSLKTSLPSYYIATKTDNVTTAAISPVQPPPTYSVGLATNFAPCGVIPPDDLYSGLFSMERVQVILNKEITFNELINFARIGMNTDPEASKKARAYDTIVNREIENALENGVRANGTTFDENRWRKILNILEYDDIVSQSREWLEQAKRNLNAGKRISKPQDGVTLSERFAKINPEDYNFTS